MSEINDFAMVADNSTLNAALEILDGNTSEPEMWRRDLIAAGWREERMTVWRAPDGGLWRGPYGAWRELQRRVAA